MRFPPEFLDELRARLPVSEVVGRRVRLRKRGREFVGLSPFNQEKTPSFTVNDQKGFYHDFSSGRHGNIFDFVVETEGVSFPEAVERLAALAGLPLPQVSKDVEAREQRRQTLHEIMELAARFFEATLAARAGTRARAYLADRGIAAAMQRQFRLGYAPAERFALKEHLGAKGVAVADMVEAGLLIAGDDIPVPFDRFRDRLMFPISDWRGQVIAFGGRALQKDAQPKYLNSPETPLFRKGATLYNGAAARSAAHRGATVIAVEGYVDVIAMVSAGYEATVAPLGTALTEDQLAALWRLSDEPVLCFDGDKAGTRAAYRAIDLALPRLKPGKSVRFALLPEDQDPDDLVRAGGREAVEQVTSDARPLSDLLWLREVEAGRVDTPERRAALEARVADLCRLIADDTVQRYYRQEFAARISRLFRGEPRDFRSQDRDRFKDRGWRPPDTRGRYAGAGRGQPRAGMASAQDLGPRSRQLATSPIVRGVRAALPTREALILIAVINHPWLLEAHAEDLAELDFRNVEADRLRRALLDHAHSIRPGEHGAASTLREVLAAGELGPVVSRIEAAVTHRSDWPTRPGTAADDVRAWWNHVVTLHRKTRTLNKELKEAEQALGAELTEANLVWLRDVQQRLEAVEGSEALIEGFGLASGRPTRGF
jgi:DNA primase